MVFLSEFNEAQSIFEIIAGQPFFVSLLLVSSLLFALYTVLEKLKVKGLQRVLTLIPVILAMAVFYFEHGPLIATVLLSVGFLLSFIMAFAQLGGGDNG